MIGQTNKQQRLLLYIYILAWEPSAAQFTKSLPVYPQLNDFTGKLNFRNWSRSMHSTRISKQSLEDLRQIGPGVPEL